eukprot:scaffold4.g4809.t1
MGLAEALSHPRLKRKRLQSPQSEPQSEPAWAPPASGAGLPACAVRPTPGTRSARRQENKARRLAREQARQAQQQQQQQQAAGDGSDSEGQDVPLATVPWGQADKEQAPGATAYRALLYSLKSSSREFAAQRQQREREEAGIDGSESEEDGTGEEGTSDSEQLQADSELSDEGAGGGRQASDGEEEEEEGEEEGDGGGAGSEDELHTAMGNGEAGVSSGGDDDVGGSSDEEEEGQQQQQQAGLQRRDSGGETSGAAPTAPQDCYASHFDRELEEQEAAALQAGGGRRFLPCTEAAPELQRWGEAQLQATDAVKALQQAPDQLAAYGVKERLASRWRDVALGHAGGVAGGGAREAEGDFVCGQQRALFALLSSYADLLLPCRPYPTDAAAPDPEMDAVLLHVLSHCAKAADRIKRNNERIKAAAAAGAPLADPPRDQGFTRPKALILLPMRNSAQRVVQRLAELAVKETRTDSVQGKARLLEEFGGGEDEEELSARAAAGRARRPADHLALFSGNLDDHFRLGVKLTRGAVRLFADLYQSDVLLASPVALATKLAEKEEGAADFLSSIEILVMDRADVLLMQNWEHVRTVLAALNHLPSQQRGADIMRVRPWALSGWGRLYRQTVLLSSFASPEMNALLGRACTNYSGCFCLKPAYEVIPQVRQVFERLPPPSSAAAANGTSEGGSSMAAEADGRLEHFRRVAWPRLKEAGGGGGQLFYVPSYFDFVRVRNFLKGEGASFLVLSEYVEQADAARARSYFFSRRRPLLLLTERAQFYHRYRIRGIKSIFFYQLPEHAQFYAELLNLMDEGEGGGGAVHALFSRLDAPRLERVVGSQRCAKMLKRSGTNTFLFC